jgi:hypothetical protein
MNSDQAQTLRALLRAQTVAALGTLHNGEPFVSMVPFASVPNANIVIHVSRLATHTQDMEQHPSVSVLVIAPPVPDALPQALARLTLQGQAMPCPTSAAMYAEAKAAYLARFPQSAPMFGFGDFSLFSIAPTSARFVGGFAQAMAVKVEALVEVLREEL